MLKREKKGGHYNIRKISNLIAKVLLTPCGFFFVYLSTEFNNFHRKLPIAKKE